MSFSRKRSRVPGFRYRTLVQIAVAPASRAALTTSSSSSGRSEIPGRIGAIPTLTSIPASTSVVSARRRCLGGAVPGSVERQMSWSRVGTEKVTLTEARRACGGSWGCGRGAWARGRGVARRGGGPPQGRGRRGRAAGGGWCWGVDGGRRGGPGGGGGWGGGVVRRANRKTPRPASLLLG